MGRALNSGKKHTEDTLVDLFSGHDFFKVFESGAEAHQDRQAWMMMMRSKFDGWDQRTISGTSCRRSQQLVAMRSVRCYSRS